MNKIVRNVLSFCFCNKKYLFRLPQHYQPATFIIIIICKAISRFLLWNRNNLIIRKSSALKLGFLLFQVVVSADADADIQNNPDLNFPVQNFFSQYII